VAIWATSTANLTLVWNCGWNWLSCFACGLKKALKVIIFVSFLTFTYEIRPKYQIQRNGCFKRNLGIIITYLHSPTLLTFLYWGQFQNNFKGPPTSKIGSIKNFISNMKASHVGSISRALDFTSLRDGHFFSSILHVGLVAGQISWNSTFFCWKNHQQVKAL